MKVLLWYIQIHNIIIKYWNQGYCIRLPRMELQGENYGMGDCFQLRSTVEIALLQRECDKRTVRLWHSDWTRDNLPEITKDKNCWQFHFLISKSRTTCVVPSHLPFLLSLSSSPTILCRFRKFCDQQALL